MNYWTRRIDKQNESLYNKTLKETEKQLQRYYLYSQETIQKEIEILYDKLLSSSVDGTLKVNDLYRYNRYFELMNTINKQLVLLGHKEIEVYKEKFLLMYDGVQRIISQEAPKVISKTFMAAETADEIVKSVWCADGKHWSDRVWDNKKALQQMIEKGLVDSVVRGVPKDEMVKSFQSVLGAGFNQADRIARTEMTFVQNQSTIERYKKAGIQRYKILSAKDDRTSDICKKQNGKVYEMDKAKAGVNMPPFHCNCRSTIIPVLEV